MQASFPFENRVRSPSYASRSRGMLYSPLEMESQRSQASAQLFIKLLFFFSAALVAVVVFVKAMSTLYHGPLVPAPKPNRIGLLFTHDNGEFRAVSVSKGGRLCCTGLKNRLSRIG